MSWLGLCDRRGGELLPPARRLRPRQPVSRGGLMFECGVVPALGPQTILQTVAQDRASLALRLTLHPDGRVELLQHREDDGRSYVVQTGLISGAECVTILWTWDEAARTGILSVEIADTGALAYARVASPLIPRREDMLNLVARDGHAGLSPGAVCLAIADHSLPLGPQPTLNADLRIETPHGPTRVGDLRPGTLVRLAGGGIAQVRWVGRADLPARGRFRPLRLSPIGALDPVICAADQRLRISGPDVTGRLGAPAALARAGDLFPAAAGLSEPIVRYAQVVLDSPLPLMASGFALEPLYCGAFLDDPVLRRLSLLRDFPPELLPAARPLPLPLLRPFEARDMQRAVAA